MWWLPLTAVLFIGSCTNTPKIATLDYVEGRGGMSKFKLANTTSDFTLIILPMHIDSLIVPDYSLEEVYDGVWKRLGDWHPANPRGFVLDEFDVNECFQLGPHKTCEFSIPTPHLTNEWRIVVSFEAWSNRGYLGRLFMGESRIELFGGAISPPIKGLPAVPSSTNRALPKEPQESAQPHSDDSAGGYGDFVL